MLLAAANRKPEQEYAESLVLEKLGSLDIHVQGMMQLQSRRRDQDPAKDRPATHTS